MKIFSSFDINFAHKILEREKQIHGPENVLLITHSKFFYYFMVLLPAILVGIMMVIYLTLYFYLGSRIPTDFKFFYYFSGLIFFVVLFFPLGFKILRKYIDYILDFMVVTPKMLIYYDQKGIFTRRGRTVDADKIKTITVSKSGLLGSIFNFGSMMVLSEGDEQGAGEINFKFIDAPEELKVKILKIIGNKG